MLHPSTILERQMDRLHKEYEAGNISREDYDQEMQELEREYNEMAREAECEAAERERANWY